MRVLLVGGTGVLARYLIPVLVSQGHHVLATTRRIEGDRLVQSLGGQPASADILEADSLPDVVAGQDAVVNLATHFPQAFPGKPADFARNDRICREGTANLLAAAQAAGVQRVVLQSRIWVHGDTGGAWIDETAPLKPGPLAQSAVELEQQGRDFATRTGATVVTLRLGGLYAAEAWHTREIIDRLRRRLAPVIGHGDNYQCFIHAADAAAAFATAVTAATAGGAFFATDDEPVYLGEYLKWLARETGAPAPFHVPQFMARMTLGNEMTAAYTASLRCRNNRLRQLGWSPRYPSFRDGYAEVLPRLAAGKGEGGKGKE